MIARILRILLERRLFRIGQRTGTLVTSPSSNEPFDDPRDFGDAPDTSNIINLKGRN